MGQGHHLSRREILNSIWALGSGGLLLPLSVLQGERQSTQAPAVIRGALRDGATGRPIAAKIRVTNTWSGEAFLPVSAIKTMPQRTRRPVRHYFYARGAYEVAVPPGVYQIEVVRGICHELVSASIEVGAGSTHVRDFSVPALRDLQASGWYSGNTHTHYHLELDENPDDRLRLVPPAEALDVSVISYLIRNQGTPSRRAEAAGKLVDEIEGSISFIRKRYRFASEADKALALGRFEQGKNFYAKLIAQS